MKTLVPNGQVLTVEDNPHGFFGPWGFEVLITRGSDTLAFTSGTTGSFELTMEYLGRLPHLKIRSATTNRRRIRAFEDPEDGGTHFVWSGPHHEVLTYVKATGVPLDRFVGSLGVVRLDDGPDGIRITPRRGTSAQLTRVVGVNTVPDVCTVSVEPVQQAADRVPAWRGARAAGGEVWRDDVDGRRIATLANTTTLTQLSGDAAAAAEVARLAQTIRVSLSAS